MPCKTLVIGIGNIFRRDDGIGPVAVRRIKDLNLPHVKVFKSTGDLTSLFNEIQKCEKMILIDSISGGGTPGSIYKIDAFNENFMVRSKKEFSTHGLGIIKALELLNELSGLPEKIIIYGVEGQDFLHGEGFSDSVSAAADKLVDEIAAEIQRDFP